MRTPSRSLSWLLSLSVLGALVGALAGCAGAGVGGTGSSPTRQTRERVMGIHRLSLQSFGLSGLGSQALFGSGGGAASGGGVGGGQPAGTGIPMLGAFVRGLSTGPIGRTREGGGGGSPPDPDPQPDFYFDEYLGLWVQIENTATSYRCLFYEDEAKEHPAGSMETTWPDNWNTYPQTYGTVYEFLAGTLAGSHGRFECVITSEFDGTLSYEDLDSEGSRSEGTSEWSAGGYRWDSRWDGFDGGWCTDSGEFEPNGSGRTVSEDSFGYKLSYWYRANGSGHGRIEGPDPGLPAIVTWDAEGNMRIVYADGTVETFPGYGWIEPGGGQTQPGG